MNIKYIITVILLAICLSSCSDFLDIDPPSTQVSSQSVFASDATAISAINGVYNQMITSGFASGGLGSITILGGLSADELINYSTTADRVGFFTNTLRPTNGVVTGSLWTYMYKIIYGANAVIEGLEKSTSVSPALKAQLLGEAKFIRGFTYFYLVNLFGDVPLIIGTDYQVNNVTSRTSAAKVIEQVITDLTEAMNAMSETYPDTGERSRPNKFAAAAMLARVYLYAGQSSKAAELATTVINSSLYQLTDLSEVFLKNSDEAIWQLRPSTPGLSTQEGNIFILLANPANVSLSPDLFNLFSSDDARRDMWIKSAVFQGTTFYYPFKYKEKSSPTNSPNEYSMVIRLAEMYLIRSEAKAMASDIAAGISDLNEVRNRAGLSDDQSTTKDELLASIQTERRKEFLTEWGHRWFDLIRTSNADAVLQSIKGSNWQPSDKLYPIPQAQIDNVPGTPQNPGY